MSLSCRPLLLRANRLLGASLVEANLVTVEQLEGASQRVLEHAAAGRLRDASLLRILVLEQGVLREDVVLSAVLEEPKMGLITLRHYEVPEEVRRAVELDTCWATWTVPFDRDEDIHFVATAYALSPAVRAHWEKTLGGQICWFATTMETIVDVLEEIEVERGLDLQKTTAAVSA